MVRILILFLLCTQCLAVHNPAIPDTIFCRTNASDCFFRAGSQFFVNLRGASSGTVVTTNAATSERCLHYYANTAGNPDSLARVLLTTDTVNAGSVRALFTNSFRVDSVFFSGKFENRVDSSQCTDSIYIVPRVTTSTGISSAFVGSLFDDAYSGVGITGYDTTKYVAFLKRAGTNRELVKFRSAYSDTLKNIILTSSATPSQCRFYLLSCADFRADSVLASTGNYIESLSMFFAEAAYNDTWYILVYWTDTTPPFTNNGWQVWGDRW